MSSHSKSPWGWGLREFGYHMVFKGDGEGISCRQQSIKVGGGGLKLTANQMGIIKRDLCKDILTLVAGI